MLRKLFRPKAIVHWDIIEKETVDTKSGKEQEFIFIPQKVAETKLSDGLKIYMHKIRPYDYCHM